MFLYIPPAFYLYMYIFSDRYLCRLGNKDLWENASDEESDGNDDVLENDEDKEEGSVDDNEDDNEDEQDTEDNKECIDEEAAIMSALGLPTSFGSKTATCTLEVPSLIRFHQHLKIRDQIVYIDA